MGGRPGLGDAAEAVFGAEDRAEVDAVREHDVHGVLEGAGHDTRGVGQEADALAAEDAPAVLGRHLRAREEFGSRVRGKDGSSGEGSSATGRCHPHADLKAHSDARRRARERAETTTHAPSERVRRQDGADRDAIEEHRVRRDVTGHRDARSAGGRQGTRRLDPAERRERADDRLGAALLFSFCRFASEMRLDRSRPTAAIAVTNAPSEIQISRVRKP